MGLVKLCGMVRTKDVESAVDAGADLIGMVIDCPTSPRSLGLDEAAALARANSGGTVAVLVDPSLDTVGLVIERVVPNTLQFSGRESPSLVQQAKNEWPGVEVWKAVHLDPTWCSLPSIVREMEGYAEAGADAILIDSFSPDAFGGTGRVVDWTAAARLVSVSPLPVVLAGGLTTGNVSRAITEVRPSGVDVSSGIETRPGVKNVPSMYQFVAEARHAFQITKTQGAPADECEQTA